MTLKEIQEAQKPYCQHSDLKHTELYGGIISIWCAECGKLLKEVTII